MVAEKEDVTEVEMAIAQEVVVEDQEVKIVNLVVEIQVDLEENALIAKTLLETRNLQHEEKDKNKKAAKWLLFFCSLF